MSKRKRNKKKLDQLKKANCTVADLIKKLQELPQDAFLVELDDHSEPHPFDIDTYNANAYNGSMEWEAIPVIATSHYKTGFYYYE